MGRHQLFSCEIHFTGNCLKSSKFNVDLFGKYFILKAVLLPWLKVVELTGVICRRAIASVTCNISVWVVGQKVSTWEMISGYFFSIGIARICIKTAANQLYYRCGDCFKPKNSCDGRK